MFSTLGWCSEKAIQTPLENMTVKGSGGTESQAILRRSTNAKRRAIQ